MNRIHFPHRTMLIAIIMLAGILPLVAQRPGPQKRLSPHETISRAIGEDWRTAPRVIIVYGRPYTKAPKTGEIRKIWGGLVPYGKVWRSGADEATLLITQKPLMIGATEVSAGAYTLFMLPVENGPSKLIISKQIGQWGLQYDPKQDFARVDLKQAAIDTNVDQFTMAIDNNPAGGGTIRLTWEKTEFSLDFTIKAAAADK